MDKGSKQKHWKIILTEFSPEFHKLLKATEQGFNYKFMPIQKVLVEARKLLKDHGLGFFQGARVEGGVTILKSALFYISDPDKDLGPDSKVEIVVPKGAVEKESKHEVFVPKELEKKDVKKSEKNTDVSGEDPQSFGSMITYIRRYSLYIMLGIQPEKDNDGKRGWGKKAFNRQSAPFKRQSAPQEDYGPPLNQGF